MVRLMHRGGMPAYSGFAPGLRPKRVTNAGARTRKLRKEKSAQQQQKQKEEDMLVRAMYREALWGTAGCVGKVIVGAVAMAVVHVVVFGVKPYFELTSS